jgi:hypothetical protein
MVYAGLPHVEVFANWPELHLSPVEMFANFRRERSNQS